MHNVPPDAEWLKVFYRKDNPLEEGYYFPRPCMQCQNPPCVNVCPVGAALHRPHSTDGTKEGDGLVLIDYNRCIGCRACMAGCPYQVRYFNWSQYDETHFNTDLYKYHSPMYSTFHIKGVMEKCDFCSHMAYQGKLSACTAACPKGAIYYGNHKENAMTNSKNETINVKETISKRSGFRFKEEYNTRPRVYYLPKTSAKSGS
jgi:molybdopterin-containing oxidoreductase family iron-sulfur binding subunit